MNILSIDAITPLLSITASGPAGMSTIELDSGMQHAERIVGAIDTAVALSGFEAKQTEILYVPEGPGSFTGLRLAWSAARAIQLASNSILRPVSPLACYAYRYRDWPGVVLSVIDAKKGRYYLQAFRRGTQSSEALDLPAEKAAGMVDPAERILVTGPDARQFASDFSQAVPLSDITAAPFDLHGASKAFIEFANSQSVDYTVTVPDHQGPIYVRKSDAEENYTGH